MDLFKEEKRNAKNILTPKQNNWQNCLYDFEDVNTIPYKYRVITGFMEGAYYYKFKKNLLPLVESLFSSGKITKNQKEDIETIINLNVEWNFNNRNKITFMKINNTSYLEIQRIFSCTVYGNKAEDTNSVINTYLRLLYLNLNDIKYDKHKKTDYLICDIDKNEKNIITLSKEDIRNYYQDRKKISVFNSKNTTSNLIDVLNKSTEDKIPCFYIQENIGNNVKLTSFGHTPFFRLKYHNSIDNLLPKELINKNYVDITKAIFGIESNSKKDSINFASRVFFEDAILISGTSENTPKKPKILSSPKATAFQNYLVQTSDDLDRIKHYDSDNTKIRGNKLYWHQDNPQWEETNPNSEHDSQYTKIKPVNKGAKFVSKIRFENLSKTELGALLFVLKLDTNCHHKIGMGKPLGLGSIKITPKLFLSDRKKRYEELFSDDLIEYNENNFNSFINEFTSYIVNSINTVSNTNYANIWEIDRIKELKSILTYSRNSNNNLVRYLELDEFKKRGILPLPTKVFE